MSQEYFLTLHRCSDTKYRMLRCGAIMVDSCFRPPSTPEGDTILGNISTSIPDTNCASEGQQKSSTSLVFWSSLLAAYLIVRSSARARRGIHARPRCPLSPCEDGSDHDRGFGTWRPAWALPRIHQ